MYIESEIPTVSTVLGQGADARRDSRERLDVDAMAGPRRRASARSRHDLAKRAELVN